MIGALDEIDHLPEGPRPDEAFAAAAALLGASGEGWRAEGRRFALVSGEQRRWVEVRDGKVQGSVGPAFAVESGNGWILLRGEEGRATHAAVARVVVARSRERVQTSYDGGPVAMVVPRLTTEAVRAGPMPDSLLDTLTAGVAGLRAGGGAAPLLRLLLLRPAFQKMRRQPSLL